MPKITIVTPSFNQAQFLENTLRSVIDQDYPNLEYIVMDGGSTDGSVEIIQKYAHRITHWESGKDKGQADAIYRGFSKGTGEILGWVNSDDLLLPGSLKKVGKFFAAHPEEILLVGGCILIGSNGRPIRGRFELPSCNLGTQVTFHQLLFAGCYFNQPASFWRRDGFYEVGGFDTSLTFCFDYDMYFRLTKCRRGANIKELLACFRIHDNSKSSTLQNICAKENEKLWIKYGLYEHCYFIRRIMLLLYYRIRYMRNYIVKIKLLLSKYNVINQTLYRLADKLTLE